MEKLVFSVLSTLLFFPSITFGVLSAEVFPWAILFSLIYCSRYSYRFLILVACFFASSIFTVVYNIYYFGDLHSDVIRSLAAYFNFLLLFQAMLVLSEKRIILIRDLSKKVFWGLIFIGLLQTFGPNFLGDLIKVLVPRGEGVALVSSNRGATLLSTEPARAGVELTLIYLTFRFFLSNRFKCQLLDIFLILFQLIIIKSASSFVFTLGALILLRVDLNVTLPRILGLVMLIPATFFIIFEILPNVGGRASDLASYIIENGFNNEVIFYIANESGNRILAIYAFFKSGFANPFGYGVGSWTYSSMYAVLDSGFNWHNFRFYDVVGNGYLIPFRGPGVISNLMLDFGIFGTIFVSFMFFLCLVHKHVFTENSRKALVIFLFKIFIFGSPGNPIVFIFFMVVFCLSNYEVCRENSIKEVK